MVSMDVGIKGWWCSRFGYKFWKLAWRVDKSRVMPELSPAFCVVTSINPVSAVWSTFQGLFKHMQLLIEIGHLLAFSSNLAYGMQYGCMVAAAKQFTYFRQALLR